MILKNFFGKNKRTNVPNTNGILDKEQWKKGIDFEIEFWSSWFESKGLSWSQDYKNRLNKDLVLQSEFVDLLNCIKSVPSILDVGAGPLTALGKVMPDGTRVNLTAVDPLAKYYKSLLDQANLSPLVETKYAEVERLDEFFSENQFDLVHMCNALDHCYDPLRGLFQMLKVVKRKSNVYLKHSSNEAEKENYTGFHQWNISCANGKFIFWNKTITIDVQKEIQNIGSCTFQELEGGWNKVVIKKL